MKDLIDRQSAIEAVSKGCQEWRGIFGRCVENILALPPAQPYTDAEIQKIQGIEQAQFDKIRELAYQEGKADAMRWISCADRFPEYGEAVLTINEDEDYEVNHIIDEDTGEWFYEGAIAWMPLPPYREG